jgi:hypothetical protein
MFVDRHRVSPIKTNACDAVASQALDQSRGGRN